MDPRFRLHRRYPGQDLAAPRPGMVRLFAREREARPDRVLAGESVHVTERKTKAPHIKVRPEPNAPLLKRIVRYPYRLHTTQGRRTQVFEPVVVARDRAQATPPSGRVAAEARGTLPMGNPLRTASTGYRRRGKLPTVEEWLGGERK